MAPRHHPRNYLQFHLYRHPAERRKPFPSAVPFAEHFTGTVLGLPTYSHILRHFAEAERTVPRNIAGNSLLPGSIFCGHCGSWPNPTTNSKDHPCKDDPNRIIKRVQYTWYGKTRKQTECDGQTGYTAHISDGIIDKLVRQIFKRMKSIPKEEIINIRREKMEGRKGLLRAVKAEYAKATAEPER